MKKRFSGNNNTPSSFHTIAVGCFWPTRTILLLTLLACCTAVTSGQSGGVREARVLAHLGAQRDAFAALDAPDPAASQEFAERLLRAADVAGSLACDGAEAEAMLVLGEHFMPQQAGQAEAAFRRALACARRCGDWQREIRALEGTLALLLQSQSEATQDQFSTDLAGYLDISTVNDRLLDALAWFEEAGKGSPRRPGKRDRSLVGVNLLGRDYLAYARITGDTKQVSATLQRFHRAGLVLLAGSFAEEFEDVLQLEAALVEHGDRGDARAQARVGSLLLELRPKHEGNEQLRRRTFDAAVRAGDQWLAADLAPDEATADAFRRRIALESPLAEHGEESLPDWKRDGRWPDEADAFHDTIVAGLAPEGDYRAKSELMQFAHADGSRGNLPFFFEQLKSEVPSLREAAAHAVGELSTLNDLPELVAALDSEHHRVRMHIAMTLATMVNEDESIPDLLEARLAKEKAAFPALALRWGLAKAGRKQHLDGLRSTLRSTNDLLAATASVAMLDLGFTSAQPVLEKNSRPGLDTRAAEETASLLGYTSSPEALFFLERFAREGTGRCKEAAARSLMRFETPRARAFRKSRLKSQLKSGRPSATECVWWGLRDVRRGRYEPEETAELIDAEISQMLDFNFLESEALEWITGEHAGEVNFRLDVVNEKDKDPTDTSPTRKVLRGLQGRKTDSLWADAGSAAKKRVDLRYKGKLEAASLHVDLEPVATLVDPTLLTINLHRTQRHSGIQRDQLTAKLWLNFELVVEAQDALKEVWLEDVGGHSEPLRGDGTSMLTFAIPESVTTADLRQAELVVKFSFFSRKETVRFPLAAILHVGDEIRPDLVAAKLDIDPSSPRPLEHCLILLDVANSGSAAAPPAEAVVYVLNQLKKDGRREIGRIQVPPLAEGERVELALGAGVAADYYLSGYTPGWTPEDQDTSIEVIIDPEDRIPETDEDNNRRIRPVAFILTDEERAARDQDTVLAKLNELAGAIQGFGPDHEPQALRDALKEMLEQLRAIRPSTPALEKARRLLQMLGAQVEARDRLRHVIPKVLEFDPATGTDQEAAEMLGELVRAQADLLRSGVPITAKQVEQIARNCSTFETTFGGDYQLLDSDQEKALERAMEQVRISQGGGEIFGTAPKPRELDFASMLGPEVAPEERKAARAFLERNLEWNRDGLKLANDTFHQAIGNEDRWFSPRDMDSVMSRWHAWGVPPEDTPKRLEAVSLENQSSAAGEATESTSRNMLKRLGF